MFYQSFSVWDTRSLGSANPRMIAWSVPIGAFLGFSQVIGLSIVNAEKLWFYFLFTFSGLSMYYLATTIVKNKNRHLVGVVAALFYMFNPYLATGLTNWPYLWLTYSSLPLMLGLFINGVSRQKGLRYIFLMCLVWWPSSSSQFVNPKYAILEWLPLVLYLVFHILENKNKTAFIRSMRFTAILAVIWALLNSYWLLPSISYFSQITTAPNVLYSSIGQSRLLAFTLNSAPLPDAIRLLGFWSFSPSFAGFPIIYWAGAYYTPLFIFVGYLIPLIAFISLLFKKDKRVMFFALFSIIAIFCMNGTQSPFGQINTYSFSHIPFGTRSF